MKNVLKVLLPTCLAVSVLQASPSDSSKVITCKIAYQAEDSPFINDSTTEGTGFWMLGDRSSATLRSDATNGYSVYFESFTKNGNDMYSFSIREASGKEVFNGSSPWKGLKLELPVDFIDGEEFDEDPPHIVKLILTCKDTYAAG